jgi:hypothetical protein
MPIEAEDLGVCSWPACPFESASWSSASDCFGLFHLPWDPKMTQASQYHRRTATKTRRRHLEQQSHYCGIWVLWKKPEIYLPLRGSQYKTIAKE